MRAVVLDRFGPPSVLRMGEVPDPVPAPGELLVRVEAVGVNAIDWATRAGEGVPIAGFPAVLGWDVCGTVVADGAGFAAGERVFGMPRFPAPAGAYAELVAAPADQLAAVPDGVDEHTAAGVPMVALTAWTTLFTNGGLEPGQRVLVNGAAGGVGHVAVQLAKHAGAEVIGSASPGGHDFVAGLGADRVVDYTEAARLTDVDLVVDPRGGEDFARMIEVLRPGGIIVTLKGEAPGQRELARARGKRAGFTYVTPDGATLSEVATLIAAGRLRVTVDRVLPLSEAAAAHEIGERGHVRGRLVLDVAP
jgi:NADPH:quinone reductase-like Zn-dependent oxidoreductase